MKKAVLLVAVLMVTSVVSAAPDCTKAPKSNHCRTTTTTTLPPTTTTTAPATTTTTTPTTTTSSPSSVVWSADHETGDTSQYDFIAISGDAGANVVQHSGDYALELWIRNADGQGTSPGVRMEVNRIAGYDNMPVEATYSAWYYFPQSVYQAGWFWNVFQWKRAYITSGGSHSRNPVWVVNVDGHTDGSMEFQLERKVDYSNRYMPNGVEEAVAPITIPVGQWIHFECVYRWSMDDGRIACWQDGTLLWDLSGVPTDIDTPFLFDRWNWSVNNYAADTVPQSHSIYVDDAEIRVP